MNDIASKVIMRAMLTSDPEMMKCLKLKEFAKSVDLRLGADGDEFVLHNGLGTILFRCTTPDELNEWFKVNLLEEVL